MSVDNLWSTKAKPRKFFHDEDFNKPKAKSTAKFTRTQNFDDLQEPATFLEAIEHPTHSNEWEKAIQEEYNSIIRNGTWKLVPRPKGHNVVSSKWLFKHKKDEFE